MRANDCIKAIAREQGMSMAQVARATNQSPQNLWKKLQKDSIRVADLICIADALGMELALMPKDGEGTIRHI